MTTMPLA